VLSISIIAGRTTIPSRRSVSQYFFGFCEVTRDDLECTNVFYAEGVVSHSPGFAQRTLGNPVHTITYPEGVVSPGSLADATPTGLTIPVRCLTRGTLREPWAVGHNAFSVEDAPSSARRVTSLGPARQRLPSCPC
jgi:hypothetical protein